MSAAEPVLAETPPASALKLVSKQLVEEYQSNGDSIVALLDACSQSGDEALVCQRWLRDNLTKRMIHQHMYGDLLEAGGKTLLDIGGGITALARYLSKKNDVTLVDLLVHDSREQSDAFIATAPKLAVRCEDWFKFQPERDYDVVIANDLFPNADQRLEMFIDRYIPRAREIRMSLTYHNTPRFYLTRRIDAEEVLCMLAWNGEMVAHVLGKFASRISGLHLPLLTQNPPSLYANGRQVCMVTIRGDAA